MRDFLSEPDFLFNRLRHLIKRCFLARLRLLQLFGLLQQTRLFPPRMLQVGVGRQLSAWQRPRENEFGVSQRSFSPRFDGTPGDTLNIVSGLARQRAPVIDPFADAMRSGIVGGRCESEIAEMLAQHMQQSRRSRNRLARIERISDAGFERGLRHELRDAQRADRTDGVMPQPANWQRR